MRRFSVAVFVLVAVLSSVARAGGSDTGIGVAVDEELYRCKTSTPEVVMSFKPEMENQGSRPPGRSAHLQPFMLAPNIVSTGARSR